MDNVYLMVHTLMSTVHVACHPISVTLCCASVSAGMGAGCPVNVQGCNKPRPKPVPSTFPTSIARLYF